MLLLHSTRGSASFVGTRSVRVRTARSPGPSPLQRDTRLRHLYIDRGAPPTEAVRLSNDRDARFVDVRPLADYKRGHVIGAISAPASKIAERNKELDKLQSKPLVVYCALGASAPSVVDKLRKRGFAEVYAMRGGINAWQNAGLPISNKSS